MVKVRRSSCTKEQAAQAASSRDKWLERARMEG
jgi:hypothetical protein